MSQVAETALQNIAPDSTKNISNRGYAVLNVGNPGNKGGTGRPTLNAIAEAKRIQADKLSVMESMIEGEFNGEKVYPSQAIAAYKAVCDVVPKESIVHTVEHNVAGVIQAVSEVLVRELGVEARDRLMDAIKQAVKDNATVTTSHTMAEHPSEDV